MGDKIWFVIWSHTTKPLMNLKHLNWAQIKAYCLDSCCTVSCPNVLVRKTNDTASPAFFTASSFKRTRHVRILNDKGCNSAAKTIILKEVKTSKHFTALVLEPKSTFWYDSKPSPYIAQQYSAYHIIPRETHDELRECGSIFHETLAKVRPRLAHQGER